MDNYKEHLDNLRRLYVNANYQQRYKVIQDVLADYPLDAPNKLIAYVSAVEAYARTLLVCMAGEAVGAKEEAYKRVRYAKPMDMVLEVLASHKVSEASFFQGEDGELLRYAVEYRNLLVHDCTYLSPAKYRPLIDACERILSGLDLLARRAGIG